GVEDVRFVVAARQDFGDLLQRKLQAAQLSNDAGLVDLPGVVVAVARALIDQRGDEQPPVVVEAQRLDRQSGDLGEFADREHDAALRRKPSITGSPKGRVQRKNGNGEKKLRVTAPPAAALPPPSPPGRPG